MAIYIGTKQISNLISNDLSTSWTTSDSSITMLSDENCFKLTASVTTANAYSSYAYQTLTTPIPASGIPTSSNYQYIYLQAKVYSPSSNTGYPLFTDSSISSEGGTASLGALTSYLLGTETATSAAINDGEWHTISRLLPNYVSNQGYQELGFGLCMYNPKKNNFIKFKDLIVLDVTSLFGTTPTKEECDNEIFISNGTVYLRNSTIKTKIKNLYIGVGGIPKKVKKGYIGVNGVAKKWYQGDITFKEFFESIDSFDTWGQYASSSAIYPSSTSSTYPAPSASLAQPAPGQIWYLFYTVGSSLEISKVSLLTTTTLSLNRIRTIPINTQYLTTENSSHTGITGTQSTWGSFSLYLHSTLSNSLIEDKLLNGTINILKGYHKATESGNAENSIIIFDQNVPTEGLIMPIFTDQKSTKTSIWGVVDLNNGITSNVIKGGKYTEFGGTVWNTDKIFSYNSIYLYYYPCNSNNYIKTHGYTLLQFID